MSMKPMVNKIAGAGQAPEPAQKIKVYEKDAIQFRLNMFTNSAGVVCTDGRLVAEKYVPRGKDGDSKASRPLAGRARKKPRDFTDTEA